MNSKICSICKKEKEKVEFYSQKKKSIKRGDYIYHYPYCKQCSIEKTIKRQNSENREEILKYKRGKYFEYSEDESEKERMRANSKRRREDGLYKAWQQNNKDKIQTYNQKRWSNKKHNIPKKEWLRCKEYFSYQCAYCGMDEVEHEKRNNQQLHKEHVIHEGRNDIKNCVPACKSCNGSKNTKTLNEWYNESNLDYSRERYLKIYQWIRYDCKLFN